VQDTVREEKRLIGGTISLICGVLIIWLVVGEFMYYTSKRLDYRFTVDTEFDKKLQIDIDIVVAMPCDSIGADVMDATDRPLMFTENQIQMDPVNFELSDLKRQYWNMIRELNKKHKPGQPGLENLLFVSSSFLYDEDDSETESSTAADDGEEDDGNSNIIVIELGGGGFRQQHLSQKKRRSNKRACRIHGYIRVNKVSGNLHITPGKSLPVIGGGHMHISQFGGPSYNFSHRIQKLAFGPRVSGMMNPLDGTEEITNDQFQLYQYYAQIVPTTVHSQFSSPLDTCQYAISKRHRVVDHSRGSHGMPGIFIKYEMSPINVDVYETHRSYAEFLVRLCAIVGGIFATSGIINMLIGGLFHLLSCQWTKKPIASIPVGHVKEALLNGHESPPIVDHAPFITPEYQRPSDHTYGQPFVT